MENAPTLAKSMKISLDNFHWYAAFHDEGHHPHIHMMVWSDDPKEGFLTKDGIAAMRSKLTNAIFRDEMQQIYAVRPQKSAVLRQGRTALFCWTQGRFMMDLPEGLTLSEI